MLIGSVCMHLLPGMVLANSCVRRTDCAKRLCLYGTFQLPALSCKLYTDGRAMVC